MRSLAGSTNGRCASRIFAPECVSIDRACLTLSDPLIRGDLKIVGGCARRTMAARASTQ